MVDSCSLLVIWVWYFYNRWVHLSTSGNRRKVQSVHRVHVWVWPHHWLWGVQLCTSRCGTWEPAVWPFQWQLRVSLLCSLTQCNEIKLFLLYALLCSMTDDLLPGAELPSWKFWPSQRPLSTFLDPGRRLSSFWSSFGRCPVWCYPPICIWVFLVIFWLEVSN